MKFEWPEECERAFGELKTCLSTYPILIPPNWSIHFHVFCDANTVAVGSALCQPSGEMERDQPVVYASRQLTMTERKYSTTERECLAMVFSVKTYRHYQMCNLFVFFADHMAIIC